MRKNRDILFRWTILLVLLLVARLYFSIYLSTKFKSLSYRPPKIVINSIMKSGSTFVTETIKKSLNCGQFMTTQKIDGEKVELKDFFLGNNQLVKLHVRPQNIDWEEYLVHSNKIMVQVRDPRQSVLSLLHHLLGTGRSIPAYVSSLKFEHQIDWAIENKMPQTIMFIDDWLAFKQEQDKLPNGIKVLITTYDELLQNEEELIYKILTFYEIPLYEVTYHKLLKDEKTLFRKGDPNEWRYVFTAEQQRRATAMIPEEFFTRFGWEK